MYLIEQITEDEYLVTLTKKEYSLLRRPEPGIRSTVFLQALSSKEVVEYCKFIWNLSEDTKVKTTSTFNLIQQLREYSPAKWETTSIPSSYTYSSPIYHPVQMRRIMIDYGRQWLLAGYCKELDTLLYYYSEEDLSSLLPWRSHVRF